MPKVFRHAFPRACAVFVLLGCSVSLLGSIQPDEDPQSRNMALLLSSVYGDSLFHPSSHPISEKMVTTLLQRKLRGVPKSYAWPLAHHLFSLAQHHGFDPLFLLALIHVESSFHVTASSNKNARGLMQVTPLTAGFVLSKLQVHQSRLRFRAPEEGAAPMAVLLEDPFFNLSIGVAYLAYLRDRYNHHPFHYLAAYNAGPGLWDRMIAKRRFRTGFSQDFLEAIAKSFIALRRESEGLRTPRPWTAERDPSPKPGIRGV